MRYSRLPLWATLVAIFFGVQLLWWGRVIWSQANAVEEASLAVLRERRAAATLHWQAHPDFAEDPGAAWSDLAPGFPGIVHQPPSRDEEGPGRLEISGAEVERIQAELDRRRAMVLGEGSLFLLLALLLLWLFQRTAAREAFLTLQQRNFLHAVTHEFRSPLQSLRLALESLMRRPDPVRAPRYAQGMLADLERLEGLVENVLAVGRMDAAAFSTQPRPVDLSAAVRRALERLRATGGDALECDIEDGVVAEADPATLEPILRNLLDNARKYGEGRPVHLRLSRRGERAVLEVSDQGRGFTDEEARHLFRRFWRAGDERVRTAPGVGLGLYLVSELVRGQGARISARSPGPGAGAVFTVEWPLAAGEAT